MMRSCWAITVVTLLVGCADTPPVRSAIPNQAEVKDCARTYQQTEGPDVAGSRSFPPKRRDLGLLQLRHGFNNTGDCAVNFGMGGRMTDAETH